ncbi:hypothetical protein [Aquimarina sp. AU474]|uniref:hypothetical protein n=1 Tax=Aquimarina sp. AU474 TaxID=2108529 RepID=UPI00135A6EA3|nr:hypothetical protein [Aquimarina sp. AU474]
MKFSNLIVGTALLGSIVLFTAAGKERILNNQKRMNKMHEKYNIHNELEKLIAKELGREIEYEDVFEFTIAKPIEPKDIFDTQEEEEIVIDVEIDRFLPQDFNPYCG